MRRNWIMIAIALVVAAFAFAAVACDDNGESADPTATAAAPVDDPTEPAGGAAPTATAETGDGAGATVIVTENADLGTILTDPEGNTLYVFTVDEPNVTNCVDDCLAIWPPFTTDGDPSGGAEIPGTLGTIERPDDGSLQVTYDEAPLYYFSGDEGPGDTNGQNFGAVWFVVEIE